MKKYYLKDGGRESGPFLLDDLKYKDIRRTTFVRINDGLWEPVEKVPDLSFLISDGKPSWTNATHRADSNSYSRVEVPPNRALQSKRSARLFILLAVMIFFIGLAAAIFFSAGAAD